MNKKIISSLLALTFVLSVFASANAAAFGELENTKYQTIQYDWLKGLFGNLFSLAPSGAVEKYETSVYTSQMTQSQFPITIKCPTGYSIGSPTGSYYCSIWVIAVRSDGYTYDSHDSSFEITAGGSKTVNWWNYNGLSFSGAYNIVGTKTRTDYISWTLAPSQVCIPNIAPYDNKCQSASGGTYRVCNSAGTGYDTKTLSCASGTSCQTSYNSPFVQCVANQPSCTQTYQCGQWDVCRSNNQQTRTCTVDSCGKTTTETGTCTYIAPQPSCTPVWNPGSWGSCINGQQTRTVTTDTCGKTTTETQGCSVSPPPATCTEGQKQLNSCPDGTTYDYKICRNNNWEVIPYATSPCQQISTQPPSWDGYYVLYNNECLKSNLLPNIDRSKYTAYGDLEMCQKDISSDFDGSTTAILAIGGLSALLGGLFWYIKKSKR